MINKIVLIFSRLLYILILTAFTAPLSVAGEWTITPELSLSETYDDNLMFKDISDFEHRIVPSLKADMKSDRSRVNMSARVDVLRFHDHTDYNRENQNYFAGGEFDVSERLTVKMGGRFKIDYTFESELEESGIIADKSRRSQYYLLPGIRYNLDERSRLDLDFSYTERDNKDRGRADFWSAGGDIVWSRILLDQKTTILGGAGVEQVDFDSRGKKGEHIIYSVFVGMDRSLSERLMVEFRGGPTWTRSSFDNPGGKEKQTAAGLALNARLIWEMTEKARLSLGYNHGQYQSVYAENITRDRIQAGLEYSLAEMWKVNFDSSYIYSRTDGLVRKEKGETWQVGISTSYVPRPWINFTLGYRHRDNYDKVDKSRKDGNRYYIQVVLRFPKKM